MGWSCSLRSSVTLEIIQDFCFKQTGQNNTFTNRGSKYFFEVGREQSDGAICATINKFVGENRCKKSGSLRIEPSGEVSRGPKLLKDLPLRIVKIGNFELAWKEEVNEENLSRYLRDWNESYDRGGLNERVGESGKKDTACILDINNNVILVVRSR